MTDNWFITPYFLGYYIGKICLSPESIASTSSIDFMFEPLSIHFEYQSESGIPIEFHSSI